MPDENEESQNLSTEEKEVEAPVVGESNEELAGLLKLVAGSVRQTNERLNRMEADFRKPPVEKKEPVDASSWIAEPEQNTRRVVKETVEEAMRPIAAVAEQIGNDRNIQGAIEQYMSEGGDPNLVERYGRLIPTALKGQVISPAAVDNAIIYLTGLEANGRLDKKHLVIKTKADDNDEEPPEPPVKKRDTTMSTPTRSASPAIITRRKKDEPEPGAGLTESQKAYARRAGLTPAEAEALVNADARVDSWPRPKKKEEGK